MKRKHTDSSYYMDPIKIVTPVTTFYKLATKDAISPPTINTDIAIAATRINVLFLCALLFFFLFVLLLLLFTAKFVPLLFIQSSSAPVAASSPQNRVLMLGEVDGYPLSILYHNLQSECILQSCLV